MSKDNCFTLRSPSKRKRVDSCSTIYELSDGDDDDSVVEISCSQLRSAVITINDDDDNDDYSLQKIKDQPTSTASKHFTAGSESDESIVEISSPGIGTNIKDEPHMAERIPSPSYLHGKIKDELNFKENKCKRQKIDIDDPVPSPPLLNVKGEPNNDSDLLSTLFEEPSTSKNTESCNEIKDEINFKEIIPSPSLFNFKSEPNDDDDPGPSMLEEPGLSADYANDEDAIYVSTETYDQEKENFDALVKETLAAEKQRIELQSQDKDSVELIQVEEAVRKLNERLQLKAQIMDSLRTEDDKHNVKPQPGIQSEIDEKPSWAKLFAGANRYRHKAEGSVAEFYQHKSNFITGLKTLYQPDGPPLSSPEFAEQPKALLVSLLKHQETGLKWLQWRESQQIRGGILADDMGLGKTLSMIALILASNEKKQMQNPVAKNNNDYKKSFKQQLQLHYAQKSSLKRICLFDDSDSDEEQLVLPPKRQCQPKQEKEEEEVDHGQDDDFLLSSQERKNSARTLIICPMSVMSQWANEAESKVTHNALKVHIYHGADRRAIGLSEFRRMDLVITSYSTAVSEYKRFGNGSWLFNLDWERLILDEAHMVRNTKTACCQAVSSIKAQLRWALTGTPIQNSALDCFALLKFLNVPNFLDLQTWRRYLNAGLAGHRRMSILIKPLMLRRTKLQLQASGEMPPLPPLHVQLIDVEFSPPEMAVYKILSAISVKIFAQYLKQREQNNLDLNYYANKNTPSFIVQDVDDKYNEMYANFLRSLGYNPKRKVQGIVILVLLLRLRQFCCHPGLMVKMLCNVPDEPDEDEEARMENEQHGDLNTKFLDDDKKFDNKEECKNHMKNEDYSDAGKSEDQFKSNSNTQEDSIDAETAMKLFRPSNPIFEFVRHSAKLKLVFAKLEELLQNTSDKIIVVSQWTSFLTVVKEHLESLGHETLDFNGTMNAMNRSETLKQFNNIRNNKRILLLSLTAGGVGLNLNVANHLLMIDLHWNPQLERQAQDRIYRYGQQKPSYIYRFMCKDTVEQRIKALQDYKMEIANVVLGSESQVSVPGGNGLNLKDLKQIFGMH